MSYLQVTRTPRTKDGPFLSLINTEASRDVSFFREEKTLLQLAQEKIEEGAEFNVWGT
jgi:hypothetical protein